MLGAPPHLSPAEPITLAGISLFWRSPSSPRFLGLLGSHCLSHLQGWEPCKDREQDSPPKRSFVSIGSMKSALFPESVCPNLIMEESFSHMAFQATPSRIANVSNYVLLTRKTDACWIYADNYTAMKMRILSKNVWILKGWVRVEERKVSLLLTRSEHNLWNYVEW
jgi:hypothetical protein